MIHCPKRKRLAVGFPHTRSVTQGGTVLVCFFALQLALPTEWNVDYQAWAQSPAGIEEISGTVQSVDSRERIIKVSTTRGTRTRVLELDISRNVAVLTKDGAMSLDSVRPKHQVKLTYDANLQLVTRIQLLPEDGNAASPNAPRMIEATELGGKNPSYPSVTADGRTLFWEDEGMIWTAQRENSDSLFQDRKQLLRGRHPAISGDGKYLVFLAPRSDGQKGESLFSAIRQSTGGLTRPVELQEFRQLTDVKCPILSGDGKTLHFVVNGELLSSTRRTSRGPWSDPKPLSEEHPALKDVEMMWPFVSPDGLHILCTDTTRKPNESKPNLVVWSRSDPHATFERAGYLVAEGLPDLVGRSPRYLPSTRELFLTRYSPGRASIWIIQNFTITAAGD